jgi:UDP-glucose 4-epimerase
MLIHHQTAEKPPARVVIIGARGFVGSEIHNALVDSHVNCVGLGRNELDLLDINSAEKLSNILKADDVLVFAAAKAPCRDQEMLQENLVMTHVVCNVLKIKPITQLIYISSDAVYKDSKVRLSEESCAEPDSLHGIMHLAREVSLKQAYKGPLAIVRPTLIYGLNDPHNGYGPNQFNRLIRADHDIKLFGNGEELRDHVNVKNVAELVKRIVLMRSSGVVNAVSGEVVSFREIADFIVNTYSKKASLIKSTVRSGPMPHDGYRAFNNNEIIKAFPGLLFDGWKEGLQKLILESNLSLKK